MQRHLRPARDVYAPDMLTSTPLISSAELIAIIDEPTTVIVDCRWYLGQPDAGPKAFREGHISGAVFADLDADLSGRSGGGRHPLPTPEEFDRTLGRLGVSPGSNVVVYDDRGGVVAARLWWMLTDQGHSSTRVLDGGLQAWGEAGGPLSSVVQETQGNAAGVALRPWRGVVSIDAVDNRGSDTVVIDARASERYRGEAEPVDPKAGHIPGAVNLPTTANLNHDRFTTEARVARNFASVGVGDQTDVIVHCGSGVTACHLVLAAEIAGFARPKLYVGSWSEWSSTERPVATG